MTTYPFQTPATALEPGQIIDVKDTRHTVEGVERSESGVNVRIEFTSGLRAVMPADKPVTVVGVHEAKPAELPKAPPAPAPILVALAPEPKPIEHVRIKVGDIVQITNKEKQYYPALVTVKAVMSWGVTGDILIPALSGRMVPMHVSLNKGDYDWVGQAVILNAID